MKILLSLRIYARTYPLILYQPVYVYESQRVPIQYRNLVTGAAEPHNHVSDNWEPTHRLDTA